MVALTDAIRAALNAGRAPCVPESHFGTAEQSPSATPPLLKDRIMRDPRVLGLQILRREARERGILKLLSRKAWSSGNDGLRFVTISDRTRCGYVAAKSTDSNPYPMSKAITLANPPSVPMNEASWGRSHIKSIGNAVCTTARSLGPLPNTSKASRLPSRTAYRTST
jgi:hypothetical protein